MEFKQLSNWTVRLLYLQVAICAVAIITGIMEHDVLRGIQDETFASEAELMRVAEASDARQGIVGIFQFLIFIASGVCILRWIYVACSKARDLAVAPMRFSPGWAVGWYFIPVVNLWAPYQAMKEIWRVSVDPRNPDIAPDTGLLPTWWFLFIVASATGNAAFRSTLRAEDVGELLTANVITLLSDIASIPLAFVLAMIVRRIHDQLNVTPAAPARALPPTQQ